MVLLHPDLEIDVEAPIAKVEGLVEAAGGKVLKRDNWGKKRLVIGLRGRILLFTFTSSLSSSRRACKRLIVPS